MRILSNVPFVLAAALFGGCILGESQQSDESTIAIARLRGAIFTTLPDGTRVDANIYAAKTDVYLDGGPGDQAPAGAAALPEGDYYFQVTDPSGKVLLSQDAIECREFHVDAAGLISAVGPASCRHVTGTDVDHGALTVQLMPYADTPNPGGEYKAWVTKVSEYDVRATQFHGFVPSESKTDNYKIRTPELPPPPPPCEGDECNPPPPPPPCCGDGHLDSGEACDDGNTANGDGCSATCTIEVPPPPPDCTCGDGHLDAGEACDDGNTANGDGCSSTCTKEETSCGGCPPTLPPDDNEPTSGDPTSGEPTSDPITDPTYPSYPVVGGVTIRISPYPVELDSGTIYWADVTR